ncbi:hypothetical protein O0I10_012900 [Lichtheimia ornata]|uniref:Atp-binding cassette sub-family d member 4 n=1 Tax=Lichtheimia ornata TaxID=688661 RepID=A0AAD7USM8_9FUNG|nr:uncharacterized protein O0I10_012900 [Lichtheimia ornata]KAJ8651536.1 hypothetical protein O0I10_012900 [Lichtheimia ornata]
MRHRSSATISESEPMLELAPESTSQQPFYSFDRVFLRRLARIFHILFPSSPHEQIWSLSPKIRQRSLFWLYITFIALSCGCEILYYYTGLLPSRFYAVLSSSDLQGFIRFILPCLLLVFGTAAGKSLLTFMGGLFSLKTRQLLTQHLHDRYIQPNVLYSVVMSRYSVDNPDQRITQDVDKFAESLRKIVEDLIIAPILVIYYTWKCWSISGAMGPIMIYGYFIVGSVLSRVLIKPIVNTVFYKELAEGNFRFMHVRLRQFSEPIAFSRGEREEHKQANQKLDNLLAYQRKIVNKELPLHLANESFSYFGSILSYLIVALPIFAGAFADKDPSEMSEIISKNSFFSMYLIFKFTNIIEQSSKLSDLAGYTARIGELLEIIDDTEDELGHVTIGHPQQQQRMNSSDCIEFQDVELTAPNGRTLVSDFNLTINPMDRVVLVGPNGSGKSSLLRALAGLWHCSAGRILKPPGMSSNDIMFLSQTPYLVHGSLRNQISYPPSSADTPVPDNQIRELLELVQLSHLEHLVTSFDTHYGEEWQKMLSPGEQQRLIFARVFYRLPRFAALDEATSAMDTDSEAHIYNTLISKGIALISISHHPDMIGYHNKIVKLDGQGNAIVDIVENSSKE